MKMYLKMLLKKFEEIFYEHIFCLFYYNRFILKKWPNFFTIINIEHRQKIFDQKISRPFFQVIIPGFVTTLFAVTLFIYVCEPVWCEQYSFWLVNNFPHENGKTYSLIVAITWSSIHFLQMFYGFRNQLKYFRFLIILNPNQLVRQQSHHHQLNQTGLNEKDRNQLQLFERRIFICLKIISHVISIGAYVAMTIQVFRKSLWEVSFFWLIFWMANYIFWPYYICSALYMFPAIILSVHYYIGLKQRSLLSQLIIRPRKQYGKLGLKLANNLIKLTHVQSNIIKEIVEMNDQSKRLLTILFVGFSNLITYITYLIFFAKLSIVYRILFIIVYCGHSSTLLSMIYSCSKIASRNERFYRYNRKYLFDFYAKNLLIMKNFFKYDSINEISLRLPVGFTLVNNMLITSNTFIVVFYNMSTLFFLLMSGKIVNDGQ
ncbi:hypothetical protein DERF_001568 [Dermatophagoides farinae]|uniref:Uncharacterized protein n=1 Tax=Dermatophagoides farinae TaxID=6954 RepID=A0A922L9I5_DERFA|nr:hypothetical protein DERF_001568 [Dermatophagoides farinae]